MVTLTRDPIDIEAINREAGHPKCGAVLTFSGTVRNHHMGRQVEKLAYESYEAMAQVQMAAIVKEAEQQFEQLEKVQVFHRLGEMEVGESSIYITVATHHRPDGFGALRFIIDRIKRDVPIWKKEFYTDGESDWLHPGEGHCCNHAHLAEKAADMEPPPVVTAAKGD
jgi:molybdopterin synthase catalytic subunit